MPKPRRPSCRTACCSDPRASSPSSSVRGRQHPGPDPARRARAVPVQRPGPRLLPRHHGRRPYGHWVSGIPAVGREAAARDLAVLRRQRARPAGARGGLSAAGADRDGHPAGARPDRADPAGPFDARQGPVDAGAGAAARDAGARGAVRVGRPAQLPEAAAAAARRRPRAPAGLAACAGDRRRAGGAEPAGRRDQRICDAARASHQRAAVLHPERGPPAAYAADAADDAGQLRDPRVRPRRPRPSRWQRSARRCSSPCASSTSC